MRSHDELEREVRHLKATVSLSRNGRDPNASEGSGISIKYPNSGKDYPSILPGGGVWAEE